MVHSRDNKYLMLFFFFKEKECERGEREREA